LPSPLELRTGPAYPLGHGVSHRALEDRHLLPGLRCAAGRPPSAVREPPHHQAEMMDPAVQELVAGRFLIKREVGRGAAGIVYQASDRLSGQEVALKVIAASGADLVEQARFTREGQVLENLDHPGIVRVIAFGTLETSGVDEQGRRLEEGSPYIAMEWLDGEDLQSRQRRAPLDLRQSLEVAWQVASALAAAHDAGIVHRDIKPSNIFLLDGSAESPASGVVVGSARPSEGGAPKLRTKLVDFGVAASNDVRLTKTGAVVGTPAYMAPEQARGDGGADVRSDIYSLGGHALRADRGAASAHRAHVDRHARAPGHGAGAAPLGHPRRRPGRPRRSGRADALVEPGRPAGLGARGRLEELDALSRSPSLRGVSRVAPATDSMTMGTRLVTTLVALHAATGEARAKEIERLREQGADALPLGADSVVVHLGAQRAYGDEAARALEIGLLLAGRGARVGVATGRMRVDRTRSAGEVVDRASALARDAGDGGTLLTDATTTELARGLSSSASSRAASRSWSA
jgi:hypothetical protein